MVNADLSGDFDLSSCSSQEEAIFALYEHPANDRLKLTVSASILKTPLTGVDWASACSAGAAVLRHQRIFE
jgi:hypothetical protein